MLHIWNSNRENLTRKDLYANGATRCSKRYLEVEPMETASPCSPNKRPKFLRTEPTLTFQSVPRLSTYHHHHHHHLAKSPIRAKKITSVSSSSSINNNIEKMSAVARRKESRDIDQSKLFTFSQLLMICEQKLKDQRESLRREYEQTLCDKFAEQYDTFIKFTRDQIQRSCEEANCHPSYLS